MSRALKLLIAVEAVLVVVFLALLGVPAPEEEVEERAVVVPSFSRRELAPKTIPPEEPVLDMSVEDSKPPDTFADSEEFVTSKVFRGKAVYDVIGGGAGGGGGYGGRMLDASGLPPRRAAQAGAPPAPRDMFFKDSGVNPVVDTARETTSTFALDVDTASYTLTRAYLKRGNLPPKEAIRVEEFVNYFRYRDPKPPEGAFSARLEAAPSPFTAGRYLLRVAVQARDVKAERRKNVALTFVVDVSGSMAGDHRLGLVKRSLGFLIDRLRPEERVGLVVYGSQSRKVLDPVPVSRKDVLLPAIDSLRVDGSTNLERGLDLGYDMAAEHFDPAATNRVVLCTDGVANNGLTNAEELLKSVEGRASKGIWLSVLGFGMGNVNDALMEKLADSGNGNYAYIDGEAESRKVFTEKLTEMMEVVAADAKVQVEFDAATVASFRLLGYENRRLENKDFRNDKVDAGELGAGHQVTALYEIALKPEAKGRLATARLRFREPGTGEVLEIQESIGRAQVLETVEKASASYRLAACAVQFAELLRGNASVGWGRIHDEAHAAAEELGRPEEAVELLQLLKIAGRLNAGSRTP